MTPLQEVLRRAAADLDAMDYGWALVGGLAVSARSEPRFTADVDLAVAVSNAEAAEDLVHELRQREWTVGAAVEQDAMGRLPRYASLPTRTPRRSSIYCSRVLVWNPRSLTTRRFSNCFQTSPFRWPD